MNVYLLGDCARINGANGLILETGEAADKRKRMCVRAPRAGFTSFQVIAETDEETPVRAEARGLDAARGISIDFLHAMVSPYRGYAHARLPDTCRRRRVRARAAEHALARARAVGGRVRE